MCTSVTGAFTTIGVSTSRTPRSAKKWRACASNAARSSSIVRVEVGCQSAMARHHRGAKSGKGLSPPYAVARVDLRQPVRSVGWAYQNHRRAHVETAHLGPLLEVQRRAGGIEG